MRLSQRVLTRFATAALVLSLAGQAVAETPAPDQPAPSGPILLFEPTTGEVIKENRAGEPWYPASLTKMMTAYVVFEKLKAGKLTLDQKLPVSELAHSQPASHTGVPVGQLASVDFALQAMLVFSANDMAYVLAEGASGSIDAFSKDMNDAAKDLGLASSHFVNPNGLFDPRHISSARDLGVLAAVLINKYPEHMHYFGQQRVKVGGHNFANHNSLLRLMPEAIGMKTGFVCNSGYNLVGALKRDGKTLVSVVLGAHSGWGRAMISKDMLDEGFDRIGKSSRGKLGDLPDMAFGSIVPADMTTTVCKRKDPVTPVNAHKMMGWGISFGTFDTKLKADMALRGRLISPTGIEAGGTGGVIQLPAKAGYQSILWSLDQKKAEDLCGKYKQENATCDVMPEDLLKQMAAVAPPDPDTLKADTSEDGDIGSDSNPKGTNKPDASNGKASSKGKRIKVQLQ